MRAIAVCASGIVVLGVLGEVNPEHRSLYHLLAGMCAVFIAVRALQIQLWQPTGGRGTNLDSALSARLLAVQEEERRRLSRELHDEVGQTVTALNMELARVNPSDPDSKTRLERARGLAGETLQTIRNISLLLRPSILDDLGLQEALQWHTEEFSRRTSIECSLRYDVDPSATLSDAIRTCVYRTVQESLNNCEKHAQATRVVVRVLPGPEGLRVEIEDDGSGMNRKRQASNGLGILGMRERATALGGSLEVQSASGKGTTVSLSLPGGLDRPDSSETRPATPILHTL